MQRVLEPEILDHLAPDDPLAIRSRRDLRRLNAMMGHVAICARAIERSLGGRSPRRMVEIGCGDGTFLAALARRSARVWPGVEVWMVDQAPALESAALQEVKAAGWQVNPVTADIFEWLPRAPSADVYLANLFLHHFASTRLATLFRDVAERATAFVACEPRRSGLALWASRGVGLVGCNSVTRHDAVVSVRAGFFGTELSALWPSTSGWAISETPAGMFSHVFSAGRAGKDS